MRISLATWLKLKQKLDEATKVVSDCEHLFAMTGLEHQEDRESMECLIHIDRGIHEALLTLQQFNLTMQSEWMGGPTSGPGSEHTKTYIREPDFLRPRYRSHFTAKEVAEAKALGLLKGGNDLTGPPTRTDIPIAFRKADTDGTGPADKPRS